MHRIPMLDSTLRAHQFSFPTSSQTCRFTGRFTMCRTGHTRSSPRVTATASTSCNKQLTALGAVHQMQQSKTPSAVYMQTARATAANYSLHRCKLRAPQMQKGSPHRCKLRAPQLQTLRSTDAKSFAKRNNLQKPLPCTSLCRCALCLQTGHASDAKLVAPPMLDCPMSSTASSHSSLPSSCASPHSSIV